MKILELHYSTSWAGAERFVVDLCNELANKHEVVLCTIEDDNIPEKAYYKKDLKKNIKYKNLKCQSGLQLKAIWRIYQIIKKKNLISFIHIQMPCAFFYQLYYTKN